MAKYLFLVVVMALPGLIQVLIGFCVCFPLGSLTAIYVLIYAFILSHEVDCYDRTRDDWTPCPALTSEKGSLAGVTLYGKIYAFGGGDGIGCFSDVEVFDPAQGKWIKSQPMLEKVHIHTFSTYNL
jgi:hypothetical protein